MNTGIRLVATDIDAFRILGTSKLCHHIFRKVDENRAGASGTCNVECFFDDTAKIFTITDGYSVFCNASCDSYDINLLESIVADQVTCYLTGEAYKWNAVVVGSCKTCHKVGGSRAAGNKTYADFSGCSGVGVSFMDKGLLMAWQDDVNAALFI